MGREIHLLLPGLLPMGLGESGIKVPPMPALETLLARADRLAQPLTDPDEYACALFGLDGPDAPIGPLCRLADTGRRDGRFWFRAEPVHLVPDRDRLCLGSERPELSREEAERFVAEINQHFRDEGLELEMGMPSRWYLSVEEVPALRTHSPEGLGGADVRPHLPSGEAALRWHAWLNEIQMLLHASPVNAERQARGLTPVTGLWLWGGGVLPQMTQDQLLDVRADAGACAIRGLARLTGSRLQELPDSADRVCAPPCRRSVVVATALRDFVRSRDFDRWEKGLAHWESHWFAPLLQQLRRGRISRLELYGGGSTRFVVKPRHMWRLWRRRRTLNQIEQFAGSSHVD